MVPAGLRERRTQDERQPYGVLRAMAEVRTYPTFEWGLGRLPFVSSPRSHACISILVSGSAGPPLLDFGPSGPHLRAVLRL